MVVEMLRPGHLSGGAARTSGHAERPIWFPATCMHLDHGTFGVPMCGTASPHASENTD